MDKFIIKKKRVWGNSSGDKHVRIPEEIFVELKEISEQTNTDIKALVAEMLDWVLGNYQIID